MNGTTVLIALGGAILIALYQVKQYQDFFKFIDEYKTQHQVEVLSFGKAKIDFSGLLIALILLIALTVYTFLRPDSTASPQSLMLMAAVLAIIFGSSAFVSRMTQQIFYTQEGFFLKARFIPFDQIQGFERSQKGNLLRLKDNSTHILAPQQVIGLDELRKQGFYKLDLE